ncbi:hypothetical protein GCM10027294_25520 [Marinactinospora endophytica]
MADEGAALDAQQRAADRLHELDGAAQSPTLEAELDRLRADLEAARRRIRYLDLLRDLGRHSRDRLRSENDRLRAVLGEIHEWTQALQEETP